MEEIKFEKEIKSELKLPIIVADTGTHFQIYNPLNLDTYFVDKDEFFALAMNKPFKSSSKSKRYVAVKKEYIDNMNKIEYNILESVFKKH